MVYHEGTKTRRECRIYRGDAEDAEKKLEGKKLRPRITRMARIGMRGQVMEDLWRELELHFLLL